MIMAHAVNRLDTLKVGDRVAKNGRRDGTGRGIVIDVVRRRGEAQDTVTVRYDSGAERTAKASLWVKI